MTQAFQGTEDIGRTYAAWNVEMHNGKGKCNSVFERKLSKKEIWIWICLLKIGDMFYARRFMNWETTRDLGQFEVVCGIPPTSFGSWIPPSSQPFGLRKNDTLVPTSIAVIGMIASILQTGIRYLLSVCGEITHLIFVTSTARKPVKNIDRSFTVFIIGFSHWSKHH